MNELIVIGLCAGGLALMLFGGKTFYMPMESFLQQISVIMEKDLKEVFDFRLGILPLLIGSKPFHNGLTSIVCNDKTGKTYRVAVNRNSQMRITLKDKSRQTFYLDTVFVKDNYAYGSKSHFVKAPIIPVLLTDIEKIELQFKLSSKTLLKS